MKIRVKIVPSLILQYSTTIVTQNTLPYLNNAWTPKLYFTVLMNHIQELPSSLQKWCMNCWNICITELTSFQVNFQATVETNNTDILYFMNENISFVTGKVQVNVLFFFCIDARNEPEN